MGNFLKNDAGLFSTTIMNEKIAGEMIATQKKTCFPKRRRS